QGRADSRDSDWDGVRLHVVTGKGGTGKTTVAAALAIALASGGRRTLLIEVEGRQGIAQLFDTAPLPYEERRVASAPGGGEVYALAIDAEQALLEYLDIFYKAGRAAKMLDRLGAIDFATTIAPGLRDVLLTGKAYEATNRRAGREGARSGGAKDGRTTGWAYDAVVMDAPPTGRILRFLNVNAEVSGLARVGPIRNQADSIMRLIASPRTAVHFVSILEDMPVQETLDGIAELHDAQLPTGAVIINLERTSPLLAKELEPAAKGQLDTNAVRDGLVAVGIDEAEAVAKALVDEAARHAGRVQLERKQRRALREAGLPTYELPLLPDGIDLAGLYELAELLREQGAA
ncbi:MAG: ArsA-related P-loop ATPase, partial [Actinomycetes bacterium]